MDITLLGTGSPMIDPNRAGPSTLVQTGGQERSDSGIKPAGSTFLVDCGRGVLMRMAAAGVQAGGLTAVLLTHLHSDHITDLADVITTRWVTSLGPAPLPIIGPPGTKAVIEATLAALAPDISYRIAHHADITEPPILDVQEHVEGLVWNTGDVRITVAPTDHRPVEPTIAFRIHAPGASVVLAGDTVPCTTLDELASGADVLVHTAIRKDLVELVPAQRLRDILDYHSSVEQAAATASRAGVDTLMLTHYVPPLVPGQEEQWRALAASEFSGRIEIGDDLLKVTVG